MSLLDETATPTAPPGWPQDPYLMGNYRPTQSETVATDLEVIGDLPDDLAGTFVRNGTNPQFAPKGRYHWFDGDGMLHAVELGNGEAVYRNRWIRTAGFLAEEEAGESLWTGILEPPNISNPRGPYKDTANTDLVYHQGKLYALWWLSGAVYEIDLPTLETVGTTDFGGTLHGTMSAHPKVDPTTDELVFFSYAPFPPYLRIGVVSADGKVVHDAPIELPAPRLQHDLAITPTYDVLFDMSLRGDGPRGRLAFHRDEPSRLGLVPRFGTDDDTRWFEVDPFFMYHVINAWEEGDEVVLIGCRIDEPLRGDPHNTASDESAPALAQLRLAPTLWEWRLNTATGRATERQLDDTLTEFPRMDDRRMGSPSRYAYAPLIAPEPTLLFDGVARYDVRDGSRVEHRYPEGWYGGETPFAPAVGAGADEDDGYLLTFVAEEATGRSELHVLDASRLEDGPVARVVIPQRVPTGYHTCWVPAEG